MLVALTVAFAAVLYFTVLHALPEYRVDIARAAMLPIMTSEQYSAVIAQHRRPYVYHQDLRPGAMLVFGAEHTKDRADRQLVQMRERWKDFAPTAALIEGRLQFLPVLLVDPVAEYGEAGFAAILARDANVKAFTWEPSLDEEIAAAKRSFTREQAALFFVLRPYFGTLRQRQTGRWFRREDTPQAHALAGSRRYFA